jgi:hypothetical protein
VGSFRAIYKANDGGSGFMLQIEAQTVRAGDQLLLARDDDRVETVTVVAAEPSRLIIEMGAFEIDLRPWKSDDGRIGPWPARASRWTSQAVRPAFTGG